jgi:hypothetical protein
MQRPMQVPKQARQRGFPRRPQADVDNRTGIRQTRTMRRGPAARAAAARRALGISDETLFQAVSELPAPFVHAALGFAACALATLLRPQSAGPTLSFFGTAALGLGVGLVIVVYDRLVIGPQGPQVEAVAIPVAAVISYVALLGEVSTLALRGVGAARSKPGAQSNAWVVGLRDAMSILVLLPAVGLGVDVSQPVLVRLAALSSVAALVAIEGLRTESGSRRRINVLCGVLIGCLTAGLGYIAGEQSQNTGAALVLLAWYGQRGFFASLFAGRRGVTMVLEYLAVVCVAALLVAALRG